jgi:CelD/BcsL family acetyltransferase involved in cellulose biosynthesis
MVDASAMDLPIEPDTHAVALDCRIREFDAASFADYARFAVANPCGPHQSPAFLSAWQEGAGAEIVFAELRSRGQVAMIVPLEIATSAICRTACFPGGSHANGNFAPMGPGARLDGAAILAAIRGALQRERSDVDMLALERMAPTLESRDNPLVAMAGGASPDVALAVRLDGGFDALLERSSGKRKRKKYRSQLRKFEAAGGWRVIRASTPAEVDRLLDAFLVMKAQRFARMGIANVFAEPGCEAFLRTLYRDALRQPEPQFRLTGLEIGGTLRSVTGSSLLPTRVICDVSAITDDELSAASPGEFLFFEMIREACERGLAVFDFSVGDEHYKRLWCDTETWQKDLFLPLTARGSAVATVSRSIAAMKRAVKSSPLLWSLAKRLRRSAAGRESAPAPDEE